MRIGSILLAVAAFAVFAPVADAAPVQFFSVSGELSASDPDQTGRITNGTGKTSCAAPTTATLNTAEGARNYDAYTLANTLDTAACISLRFDQACPTSFLQYTAHLDPFLPASPLTNHLADAGGGLGGTRVDEEAFSFMAQPGKRFVIKVNANDIDATCASYALRVMSDPPQPVGAPETTILAGPSGGQVASEATFALAADRRAVSFECSLDSQPFIPCGATPSFPGLATGQHTFAARAVDPNTGADPTPATRNFEVLSGPTVLAPVDSAQPKVGLMALRAAAFSQRPRLVLLLASDEPVQAQVKAQIKGLGKGFIATNVRLTPGTISQIALRLSKSARQAVLEAFEKKTSLSAAVTVIATDGAGNRAEVKRTAKLLR